MIDQMIREEAVRLRKNGLTIAAIVEQLGVSQKSVCDIMKAAGLATKKHAPSRVKRAAADGRSVHPDVIEDIKRLYLAGKKIQHISDVTGVSDQTIRRHLKLAGLRKPKPRQRASSVAKNVKPEPAEPVASGESVTMSKQIRAIVAKYGYFGVEVGLNGGFVAHVGDASSIELPSVAEAISTARQTVGEDTGAAFASGE